MVVSRFVCCSYGMQLLNSFRGGQIAADWERFCESQRKDSLPHSPTRGGAPIDERSHVVHIVNNTRIHQIVKVKDLEVNSAHVQGFRAEHVGEGLIVSGVAPDGCVEAIESEDGILLGVLWHPEQLAGTALFEDLVERAQLRAEQSASLEH